MPEDLTPEPEETEEKLPVKQVSDSLVMKYGSSEKVIDKLLTEAFKNRETIRDLKSKALPEGSNVLSGDDHKEFLSYRQLGKLADLEASLIEGVANKKDLAAFKKGEILETASRLSGFDAALIKKYASHYDVQIVDSKDKDSKGIQIAQVMGRGEKPLLFSDVVASDFPELMDKIKAGSNIRKPSSAAPPARSGNSPQPTILDSSPRTGRPSRF